jgi:hypothetical protein
MCPLNPEKLSRRVSTSLYKMAQFNQMYCKRPWRGLYGTLLCQDFILLIGIPILESQGGDVVLPTAWFYNLPVQLTAPIFWARSHPRAILMMICFTPRRRNCPRTDCDFAKFAISKGIPCFRGRRAVLRVTVGFQCAQPTDHWKYREGGQYVT